MIRVRLIKTGSAHEQPLDLCAADLVKVRRRWNAPLHAVRTEHTYG